MSLERMTLAPHARRSTWSALSLLLLDFALYTIAIAAIVWTDDIVLKLIFGVAAGALISLLAIIGHDAGHHSFSHSKWLNNVAGIIAFLPALHPLGRWQHHHNRIHHRYTAQIGRDNAYPPMTVEDYRHASPWARRRYRFLRSIWGQHFFYLVDVWAIDMFLPFLRRNADLKARDWFELVLVYAWLAAFLAVTTLAIMLVHDRQATPAFTSAVVFCWAIPFLVWNVFIAFVSIVQHTAPHVRWTMPTGKPTSLADSLAGTVHIILPEWLDLMMQRVMKHPAHHVNVGIPLQRLKPAEAALEAATPHVLYARWTPKYHLELTRTCQLYDPRTHRWCTFADAGQADPDLARAA